MDTDSKRQINIHLVKCLLISLLCVFYGRLPNTYTQNSQFLAVMVDETTNVSNIEQVVICLSWMNAGADLGFSEGGG